MHPTQLDDHRLQQQCEIRRTRASGPGGQHRNKVETAIVITHTQSGVLGQASEKRSQHANLKSAMQRLRVNLAIEIRNPSPFEKLSPRWMSRVENRRIAVSSQHPDFPLLICEALDVLADQQHDVVAAADRLLISTSQLIKLLKINAAVWNHVQQTRQQKSLPRLK